MPSVSRGLLIGNSRWHWAEQDGAHWKFDHGPPDSARLTDGPHQRGLIWAAVGAIPVDADLEHRDRLTSADVPLPGCPDWLGVDRVLGAWAAWQTSQLAGMDLSSGLLLADAGTVLSLTLLNADGVFVGGQLSPGLRLQLRSMDVGTESLVCPEVFPDLGDEPRERFPRDTASAMVRGALQAMAGAVRDAQKLSGACLWICGGDSIPLQRELLDPGSSPIETRVTTDPDLVLKGLVTWIETISPERDR